MSTVLDKPAKALGQRLSQIARPASNALAIQLMKPAPMPARLLDLRRAPSLEEAVKDKVVVITGASSGIGEAAAKMVAAAGATTVIIARRGEELQRVADEIEAAGSPGTVHQYVADLADLDSIGELAQQLLDDLGQVDILVNNAGRSIRRQVDDAFDRMHDYERVMQINYFGPVQLVLKLLPSMLQRESGQIINVATWGVQFESNPMFSAYSGSKAALTAFGRCVNAEVADRGVKVSTIYPALIRTPMISPTAEFEQLPALTPEEAAEMITEAIRTRATRVAPMASSAIHLLDAIHTSFVDFPARKRWLTR